jgi:hypothetical protein
MNPFKRMTDEQLALIIGAYMTPHYSRKNLFFAEIGYRLTRAGRGVMSSDDNAYAERRIDGMFRDRNMNRKVRRSTILNKPEAKPKVVCISERRQA